jgi:hypothetical protein
MDSDLHLPLRKAPRERDSEYGHIFDDLARRWAVVENEHDRHHPERDRCGGVGGCSMMFAANQLESEMVDALTTWRQQLPIPRPLLKPFRENSE